MLYSTVWTVLRCLWSGSVCLILITGWSLAALGGPEQGDVIMCEARGSLLTLSMIALPFTLGLWADDAFRWLLVRGASQPSRRRRH